MPNNCNEMLCRPEKMILWNEKKPFETPVFLTSLAFCMDYKVNYQPLFLTVAVETFRILERRELQKIQIIGGLSLYDRRWIKMINDDVPNKDFIDCGLWYLVALPPHWEHLLRLTVMTQHHYSGNNSLPHMICKLIMEVNNRVNLWNNGPQVNSG